MLHCSIQLASDGQLGPHQVPRRIGIDPHAWESPHDVQATAVHPVVRGGGEFRRLRRLVTDWRLRGCAAVVLGVGDVLAPLRVALGHGEWVMKWSGVAPCQCHSSAGVLTMSPGRMVTMGWPRDWTSPWPSVT